MLSAVGPWFGQMWEARRPPGARRGPCRSPRQSGVSLFSLSTWKLGADPVAPEQPSRGRPSVLCGSRAAVSAADSVTLPSWCCSGESNGDVQRVSVERCPLWGMRPRGRVLRLRNPSCSPQAHWLSWHFLQQFASIQC